MDKCRREGRRRRGEIDRREDELIGEDLLGVQSEHMVLHNLCSGCRTSARIERLEEEEGRLRNY